MLWVGLFALAATITVITAAPWTGTNRRVIWITLALAAALPFALPLEPRWVRLLVSAFSVVFAARAWERAHGRSDHEEGSALAFLLWWTVPTDARFPSDLAQAHRNRRAGRHRLGRFAIKVAVAVALVAVIRRYPELRDNHFVFAAWSMPYVYCYLSGVADLLTGVLMQTGVHLAETFEAPVLARSPREFWSRRWNRFVHRWAFRNVFLPGGGVRAPARATFAVFVLSGLMHEYLVAACGGSWSPYAGLTLAFFVLQGLAVLGQGRRGPRWPRPVAIALHLSFLIATTPLFFRPLDAALGYSRWWTQ